MPFPSNPFQIGDRVVIDGDYWENEYALFPSYYTNGGIGEVIHTTPSSVQLRPDNGERSDYKRWKLYGEKRKKTKSSFKAFQEKIK